MKPTSRIRNVIFNMKKDWLIKDIQDLSGGKMTTIHYVVKRLVHDKQIEPLGKIKINGGYAFMYRTLKKPRPQETTVYPKKKVKQVVNVDLTAFKRPVIRDERTFNGTVCNG